MANKIDPSALKKALTGSGIKHVWFDTEFEIGAIVETKAGLLDVCCYDTWLACRFKDPEQAAKVFNGSWGSPSPYTGKWNFDTVEGLMFGLAREVLK